MHYTRMLALLICAASACGAWVNKTPLLLACNGAPNTNPAIVASLCVALEEELDEHAPERVIRRDEAPDPLPRRAWDVVLEVTRTEDYHWEAHLTWGKTGRRNNAERTTGPDVEIFGMDAPLGPGAYSHFVRSLLKVSKPAFLASPKGVNGPFQGISGSSNN